MIEVLKSKIHRATVTFADLNYEGSLTIDEELMRQAGIIEYEKVCVANINNGARFETYAIKGKKGVIGLNGAAARRGYPGDKLIIFTFKHIKQEDAQNYKPVIVKVNSQNEQI